MRKKRLEACIFRAFSLFRCQRWDYARKGAFRGQHLDSDEDLDVAAYSLEELTDAVLAGKLRDAKTMYLTLLLRELKARGEI